MTGSSETRREPTLSYQLFNFDYFLTNHLPESLGNEPKEKKIRFLEWFVGFSEGDGCFEYRRVNDRPRLSFTIKQVDAPLLYKVRAGLGFGTVRKIGQTEKLYQFVVGDKAGIRRLMALFNGNLVLGKTRARYETWVNMGKEKIWIDFQLKNQVRLPSFKSAWISGFCPKEEAEGCFYAQLSSTRLRQKFTLTQKDVAGEKAILDQIRILFESKAKLSTLKNDAFRMEINSIKSQQLVAKYFHKFPLKGKKKITSFRWWRILLLRFQNVHNEIAKKPKVKRLVNSLNVDAKKQAALAALKER